MTCKHRSKEDGDLHKEWTKALVQIFVGLRDYIKAHHKAEPSWNYKVCYLFTK